jgi:phosphohistidine phosphatase
MAEFKLIILRHGESGMDAPSDFKRTLTLRGRGVVADVSERIQSLDWVPTYLVSSDAARAKETAEVLIDNWAKDVSVNLEHDYYICDPDSVINSLGKLDNAHMVVGLVGHNPTWSGLVSLLANDYIALSPGNAALLKIDAESWEEAAQMQGAWELVQVL